MSQNDSSKTVNSTIDRISQKLGVANFGSRPDQLILFALGMVFTMICCDFPLATGRDGEAFSLVRLSFMDDNFYWSFFILPILFFLACFSLSKAVKIIWHILL